MLAAIKEEKSRLNNNNNDNIFHFFLEFERSRKKSSSRLSISEWAWYSYNEHEFVENFAELAVHFEKGTLGTDKVVTLVLIWMNFNLVSTKFPI